MSIAVEVGLLSGKTATVNVALDEEVKSLILQAQGALGVGTGRLVDSSGCILDASALIKDSKMKDGDVLTLHIGRGQACATERAFAAVLSDGSVVTWGAVHESRSKPLSVLLLPFLAMALL